MMKQNLSPQKLRIALIMDIMAPVPPIHYGGMERITDMIVRGLVERGHEVTLFASDDSKVPCRLISYGHRRSRNPITEFWNTFVLYAQLLRTVSQFDLVHSIGRTLYLLPLLPMKIQKIQTYGCPLVPARLRFVHRLSKGSITFTACSHSCATLGQGIGKWAIIYNGISMESYEHHPLPNPGEKYLAFLGRLDRIKGAHIAIQAALATGKKLKIAGTRTTSGPECDYFKTEIEPFLDGKQIEYIGPINDGQKNDFLGGAEALLFPIQWEEPFGQVVIEAMACGTPVIAFRRGAIPEILTEGVNGFICSSLPDMILAVGKLHTLSRHECRKTVETRFSSGLIVSDYEKLYYGVLSKNHRNKTSFIQSSEPEYVASQHLFTDSQ